MIARLELLAVLFFAACVCGSPLFGNKYHPIVIWHGLGDSAYSEGMQTLASQLQEAYPGVYVHLVSMSESASEDQKAGFFGNVNAQIDQVCEDLKEVDGLKNGFDAIGFSQGGEWRETSRRSVCLSTCDAALATQQANSCEDMWNAAMRPLFAISSPMDLSTWASLISQLANLATFSVDWQRVHFEVASTRTMHSRT